MNLSIPLNFGERPCDRALLANLRVPRGDRPKFLWMLLLVWRDFGIARDDRRVVPRDEGRRRTSQVVSIIEQYIDFAGPPGDFVEAAINAGFFALTPLDDESADLVLAEFFPANHSSARDISNSKVGGLVKGVRSATRDAEARAREQLGLFERSDSPLLKSLGRDRVKDALFLVHQVCRLLRRQPPVSSEWRDALASKALSVLDSHTGEELTAAYKWLAANRDSQDVPPRIDFVLDRFSEFVAKGRRDF